MSIPSDPQPSGFMSLDGASIPRKIGRHRIRKVLGRGSMGMVFLGRDPYIDRDVALKLSRREHPSADYNRDYFREARSAGRLSHPNIVAIYDTDLDMRYNSCYLAMEYIDGPTLNSFCSRESLLPVERIIDIGYQACRALDYAHQQGVVHWDIKPANIMLNSAGAVKITDFGIARSTREHVVDAKNRENPRISGTLSYMSPQHLDDSGVVDGRSDLFSLGCVLYELFCGQKAFESDNAYSLMYQITHKQPLALLAVRPDLPAMLEAAIAKALAKDPAERYQSGLEFAYDLAVVARRLKLAAKEKPVDNVLDYVGSISFFNGFSQQQVKAVLAASTVNRIPRDRVVVAEGEVDDCLYIILSGKVGVIKQKCRIDTIGRGECFGEMAYLSGQPRAATIRTLTDCILMKIRAGLMEKASQAVQLRFMHSFSTTLVERISQNHNHILNLVAQRRSRSESARKSRS